MSDKEIITKAFKVILKKTIKATLWTLEESFKLAVWVNDKTGQATEVVFKPLVNLGIKKVNNSDKEKLKIFVNKVQEKYTNIKDKTRKRVLGLVVLGGLTYAYEADIVKKTLDIEKDGKEWVMKKISDTEKEVKKIFMIHSDEEDNNKTNKILKSKISGIIENIQYNGSSIPCVKYKIQKGETLWGIISNFSEEGIGDIVDFVAEINKLKNNHDIQYDNYLYIPIDILPTEYIKDLLKSKSLKNNPKIYRIKIIDNIWNTLESYGFDPSYYKEVFEDNKRLNPYFKDIKNFNQLPANIELYIDNKYFSEREITYKIPQKTRKKSKTGKYIRPEEIPGVNDNFYKFENNIEIVSEELNGLHVILDPGHGGNNTRPFINGIQEHEVVYDIANRLFVLLKQHGANVNITVISPNGPQITEKTILKPQEDEFYYGTTLKVQKPRRDIPIRRKLANKFIGQNKAEKTIFLSIHTNASNKRQAHGLEVQLYNKGTRIEDKKFAKNIIKASKMIDKYNRGIKIDRRAGIVRNNRTRKADCIHSNYKALVELGFHSNRTEAKKLSDPKWRQKYAEMLFDAICRTYLNKQATEIKIEGIQNLEYKKRMSREEFQETTKNLNAKQINRAITLDKTYITNRKKRIPLSKKAMGEMFVYYSKGIEEHYGIPAEVVLVQTVLESHWGTGTKNRKLPKKYLNFHGLKDQNGKYYTSNEGPNSNKEKTSKFAVFNNVWESFSAYGARLKWKKWKNSETTVYHKAFEAKSPRDFIKKLAPIYSSDKKYAQKCFDVWKSIKKRWPELTKNMDLDRKL